jgi:hypothetical protein
MDSKEKTAFILLLNRNDGIITIFAQNMWTACVPCNDAKRQKSPTSRSHASNESLNFESLIK